MLSESRNRLDRKGFNTVFICYSRVDEMYAISICEKLKAGGFQVFLDQTNIKPGMVWEPETLAKLHNASFIVIILTAGSIERTGYAMKEIEKALELYNRDPNERRMICPVKVGNAAIPEGLAKFHWTEFSVQALTHLSASFEQQRQSWLDETDPDNKEQSPLFRLKDLTPAVALILIGVILFYLRWKGIA